MVTISKTTKHNWEKLKSDSNGKLTKRANKTLSKKRIVATGYLDFAPANQLLSDIASTGHSVEDIMYTLCLSYLRHANLLERDNVKTFISTFASHKVVNIEIPVGIWESPNDVLGFVYQSLITEGERNMTGQYYTNRRVADYMLNGKTLEDGETFLDPCCGSGSFLLAVSTDTPSCLYGFDINPIATMIAGTNLLVKYARHDFIPNVYCMDFLQKESYNSRISNNIPPKFDNIYTNPPWGTDKESTYIMDFPEIKSKERSSMMIVESLKRLEDDGNFYFLLPTSLLKIKIHKDIRKYILSNATIRKIDLFTDRFDGVFTDYFSIRLSGVPTEHQEYDVTSGKGTAHISLSASDKRAGNIATKELSLTDISIIQKMESLRHDDLTHSQWALGIVTGDNKSKVKKEKSAGMEPIYRGKQVTPFKLYKESSYIHFAPETFQQCAKERIYRAPEKLIYKFIATHPIVAYDNKQCLCLNSANILIPELDSISIKSAAALLNSALYHYYYSIRFTDIKVLKGNLQELPFPLLTKEQDKYLSTLVSQIHASEYNQNYQQTIDKIVFRLFNITPAEQAYILERIR